ncbi:hypothetical protein KIN20_005685 [Parelaphostrongylus tenuis]|uniref:Uncharacterized protein n=1 Tax=Parelaphostrongylus tenuis TaxID=148309 RepID=A0AAD5QFC7_PARTN|nr:hypothetical protein KIN20_005685 [Parelaphostrongylus tenuis]
MQSEFVFYCIIIGEDVFTASCSRKSTRLKGKAQQENLLLTTGFNALMPHIKQYQAAGLDLEDKHRSIRPTKLNKDDQMIAALENEPLSSAGKFTTKLDISPITVLTLYPPA